MFDIVDRHAGLVDELSAADLDALSRDELLEVVRRIETQQRRLACLDHALIAQLESRGTAHELAARSTALLLQDMLRLSAAEAGRRVRAARVLAPRRAVTGEPLPPIRAEIAKGQAAGVVSVEQARVITQALDRLRAAMPVPVVDEAEETLVGLAAEHAPKALRTLAARVVDCLDPDGRQPSEADHARDRYGNLRQIENGCYELRARLTPECGAAWQAVISALGKPVKNDTRTAGQRTHDALQDAARLLGSKTLPDCNGIPTTVLFTLSIEQLESRTGLVTTAHGGTLTVDQAITLAADADVIPVIFTDSGGILRYGRKYRFATLGQRYALQARDLRCIAPGCEQPGAWCQIDHAPDWARDGRTDIEGRCLLCTYHNLWYRKQGWRIRMIDGVPHAIPPTWIDPAQKPRRNPQPERYPLRTTPVSAWDRTPGTSVRVPREITWPTSVEAAPAPSQSHGDP